MSSITLSPLSTNDQREVASVLDHKINELGRDEQGNPETVRAIGRKIDAIIKGFNGTNDPDGFYVPAGSDVGNDPFIVIRADRSSRERCRQLRHELAHYLMHHWLPFAMYGVDTVFCWGQDNQRIRHKIAELVAAK